MIVPHAARNRLIGISIALIAMTVIIDRIFHLPAFGWLLLQWLKGSAWMNGQFGWNAVAVIIALAPFAGGLISLARENDESKKRVSKRWIALGGGLLTICVALFATGRAYSITLVPNIHNMTYEGAKDKCEAVGLFVPDKEEWQGNRVTFQIPSEGSIISKGDFVYAEETLDCFLENAREVDSLFVQNDNDKEDKPTPKNPNSASDMLATKVLAEDGTAQDCLYFWVIRDKNGKDLLHDGWYYKDSKHCDSVVAYNYAQDIKFKSKEYRAIPDSNEKWSKEGDKWFSYAGFREETDDAGNIGRWDYIGFNDYRYTSYSANGEKTYESVHRLNKDGKGTLDNTIIGGLGYKGQYSNGAYNGKGTYTYSNGEVYKGNFLENERSGKGTLTKDGEVLFKGEWKNDERYTGKGRIEEEYDNGTLSFKGSWLNGEIDGYGELEETYEDGSGGTYKGEWKNGEPEGYGEMCHDGEVYKGEFKEGLRDGYGELYYENGELIQDGIFKAGEYIG